MSLKVLQTILLCIKGWNCTPCSDTEIRTSACYQSYSGVSQVWFHCVTHLLTRKDFLHTWVILYHFGVLFLALLLLPLYLSLTSRIQSRPFRLNEGHHNLATYLIQSCLNRFNTLRNVLRWFFESHCFEATWNESYTQIRQAESS